MKMNEADYERLHHKTRTRGSRFDPPLVLKTTEFIQTSEEKAREFLDKLTETDGRVLR
ncbi:hypothetical protein KAS79_03320 [Candidatus Parcubacteria bacterium]|nr:hypothetical protein [Candidatus Parcubacteria bacterium]